MGKRNAAIDLAKYIASIMIVAIHTGLFSDVNATLNFVAVHIICRVAVPFFAVCTGYFLASRLEFGETLLKSCHNIEIFLKQWKKLVLMYAVWSVLYLFYSIPMWIEIGWFSPFAFVDYAVAAVTTGSHYHFWYLWGMIYILPIFYVLLRICRKKYWIYMIASLWLVKVVSYAYPRLVTEQLAILIQKIGVITCLLPMLLMGALISVQKEKSLRFYAVGLILSVTGLAVEAFALRRLGQEAVSYIVFSLPVAYYLFCLITRLKTKSNGKVSSYLGATSMFVYCVHPMLAELTEDVFKSSIIYFGVVAVGATALGCGYHFLSKKLFRKKEKLCFN